MHPNVIPSRLVVQAYVDVYAGSRGLADFGAVEFLNSVISCSAFHRVQCFLLMRTTCINPFQHRLSQSELSRKAMYSGSTTSIVGLERG